jgi:hypothetical protein
MVPVGMAFTSCPRFRYCPDPVFRFACHLAAPCRIPPVSPVPAMTDYQIKRNSRRCHGSGRELKAGEEYYSELIPLPAGTAGEFERRDWSMEEWKGPAGDAVGWWHSRIPVITGNRVYWAPVEVLREYFRQLRESPGCEARAWLMAMLLVRRRLLRLDGEEVDSAGSTWLVLSDPDRQAIRVPVVDVDAEQRKQIQQEFSEHLFTDQPQTESSR